MKERNNAQREYTGGYLQVEGWIKRGGLKLKSNRFCLLWQIAFRTSDSKFSAFFNAHISMHKAKSISTSSIKDGFVQLKISNSRSFSRLLSASFLSAFCYDKNGQWQHQKKQPKTNTAKALPVMCE